MIVYISYDEPRRPPLRVALAVLAILLALAALAAVIIGAVWLVNNGRNSSVAAPVDAVPLQEAVPSVYHSNSNTIFLVDVSKSIEDSGNRELLQRALLEVVIPYTNPSAGKAAENSRIALITFAGVTETLIPLAAPDDLDQQRTWLQVVGDLSVESGRTFIYDAMVSAHDTLAGHDDDSRGNVIVLLTDGLDGARNKATGAESFSDVTRDELVGILADSSVPNLKVHTIGIGAEADHISLKVLAEVTGGEYIYASR